MSLKNEIAGIRRSMRAAVLMGAAQRGSVRLHTHYADNYWTVEIRADGSAVYENYAEEARGPSGTLEDLSLWELALLLQALET